MGYTRNMYERKILWLNVFEYPSLTKGTLVWYERGLLRHETRAEFARAFSLACSARDAFIYRKER